MLRRAMLTRLLRTGSGVRAPRLASPRASACGVGYGRFASMWKVTGANVPVLGDDWMGSLPTIRLRAAVMPLRSLQIAVTRAISISASVMMSCTLIMIFFLVCFLQFHVLTAHQQDDVEFLIARQGCVGQHDEGAIDRFV